MSLLEQSPGYSEPTKEFSVKLISTKEITPGKRVECVLFKAYASSFVLAQCHYCIDITLFCLNGLTLQFH